MTPEALLELLRAVVRGEAPPEALLSLIDAPGAISPDAGQAMLRELDALHARSEIHFDLYLRVKDRLQIMLRPRMTRPPPVSPSDAATRFRATPDASDRTMLRSPTTPSTLGAAARAPATTGGTTGAAARHGQAFEPPETRTWVIEAPLEPGTLIKERFVLEQRLGEGGMGVVFKARDLRKEEARDRDPYVAIKFLSSEFRRHPEAFMALQRESRRARRSRIPTS